MFGSCCTRIIVQGSVTSFFGIGVLTVSVMLCVVGVSTIEPSSVTELFGFGVVTIPWSSAIVFAVAEVEDGCMSESFVAPITISMLFVSCAVLTLAGVMLSVDVDVARVTRFRSCAGGPCGVQGSGCSWSSGETRSGSSLATFCGVSDNTVYFW